MRLRHGGRRAPGVLAGTLVLLIVIGLFCLLRTRAASGEEDTGTVSRETSTESRGVGPAPDLRLENIRSKRSLIQIDDECDLVQEKAATNGSSSHFPRDLFSLESRQRGAVVLHFAGLIYMFVALAIVCDEFFVPALGVLTEKLSISDDVAGATFMAAGGSAPEFFTSMFGVFVAQDNVGIGTIVGSATFNILCVLAFCTLFSREVLHLTWWPLFRDMSFYIFALFLLVLFFWDEKIVWHEALIMLIVYLLYGTFMKYNEHLENAVKSRIFRLPTIMQAPETSSSPQPASNGPRRSDSIRSTVSYQSSAHRKSIPYIHGGAPQIRNGILHMAMGSDDETVDDMLMTPPGGLSTNGNSNNNNNNNGQIRVIHVKPANSLAVGKRNEPAIATISGSLMENGGGGGGPTPIETVKTNGLTVKQNSRRAAESYPQHASSVSIEGGASSQSNGDHSNGDGRKNGDRPHRGTLEKALSESSHDDSPLDMSWPKGLHKQAVYLVLAPITFPLYLTLPDTRNQDMRKFFFVTFVGSILWIALFSYLMVWWANVIGETLGIPTEIMGLTILAAGTSIPDLITSVIVARKGLGDMAVSSSIGSNLFDICVGLPIPWLLFFGIQFAKEPFTAPPHVSVSSNGLICSVGLLFMMLVVLVVSVALSSWQMDKFFGLVMIVSYMFFCILSILLETGHVTCPLKLAGDIC